MNADGTLDCFIAGDFGRSVLLLNNGSGYFLDVTTTNVFPDVSAQFVGVLPLDADGNGHVDLFLLAPGGAPSRLLMNNGSAVFIDEGGARGVANVTLFRAVVRSASAVDVDGSGSVDLYVSCKGDNLLLRNNGSGFFVDVARAWGVHARSSNSVTSVAGMAHVQL
jgi:hypothetical protein